MVGPPKPIVWLGDSLRALKSLPASVQDEVGCALFLAEVGEKHVKPLKGLAPGVLEVVSDRRGDTFRAVYTARLADRVLCCTPLRRSPGTELRHRRRTSSLSSDA